MSTQTIPAITRRLFVEACGQLNNDMAAVRGAAVKLAAETAAAPNPDQDLLNGLACIEERLRSAQTALAQNALTVLTRKESRS